MYKIGLTGGIGSGKTYVSDIFRKLGIPVFNSDTEGKKCMMDNDKVRQSIIDLFGEEIYSSNKLDSNKLAKLVFNNRNLLENLNAIIHPVVSDQFNVWISQQQSNIVIKESAILFESGTNKALDKIICICAPKETRIQRIINRDGLTREDVISRMKNQISQNKKKSLSDFLILNDGETLLLPQILDILNYFEK